MTIVALGLILVSAVMHATWNTLARQTDEPYAFFVAFNSVAAVIWLPVAVAAGWNSRLSAGDLAIIIGSGSLQVMYFVLLGAAYKRGGLTIVYPIARGTGVALVPLAGYAIFSERPTLAGWLGISATFLGLALLALGNWRHLHQSPAEPSSTAILFAFLTGLVISTYSLVDNYGVERVNPVVYGYGLIAAASIIQLPYALSRRRRAVWRQFEANRRSVLAGSVLSLGTYILVLIALSSSNVGYVVPLREMSIIIAVILGIIVLREPVSTPRLVAASVVALGSVSIAIGG